MQYSIIIQYNIGEMNVNCSHCGALRFTSESFNCCHNGKVSLPNLQEYPAQLKRSFDINDHEEAKFREYIRNYNSAFAFASFGANISLPPGRGPYCFRLHGQTYHHVSSLHPGDNDAGKYGQLYIIDGQEAVQARFVAPENGNCLQSNLEAISNLMENNPYALMYKNMRIVEQLGKMCNPEKFQCTSPLDLMQGDSVTLRTMKLQPFLLVRMELLLSIAISLSQFLYEYHIKNYLKVFLPFIFLLHA